jgi:uncharacterized membrane protein
METTLVLGGTGKTGRRVAKRLERRGVSVRDGSRSGEPTFDWEDEASWARGLVAGVFFAFSAFVMPALKRLKPAEGIAAMQSINVAAVTPAFMTVLFGTAAVCGALAVRALLVWDERSAPYILSGGAVYLVGTILLTIVYHVPRNEALAKIEPRDAGAESYWRRYLSGWTAWNHLRAATSLAAAAALTVALHV